MNHLGHFVNFKLTDDDDGHSKRCGFYGFNKLISNYGCIKSDILCKLFGSHCCSLHGSQLWDSN